MFMYYCLKGLGTNYLMECMKCLAQNLFFFFNKIIGDSNVNLEREK